MHLLEQFIKKFIFTCFTLWILLWLVHVVNYIITWLWHFFPLSIYLHIIFEIAVKLRNTKIILKKYILV